MSACCELTENLEKMRDKVSSSGARHKEEMPARIVKDEVDRRSLRTKLEISIDIFDPSKHPKVGIVKIVSGTLFSRVRN